MKKLGFTLAEVLVSLTIIGVVAALVSPTIGKMMPNKEKVMAIKAYKALYDTTRMLIEEPGFYLNAISSGLGDTAQPTIPEYATSSYSGNNKYCNLLMKNMHTFGSSLPNNGGSWVTADFMTWTCSYSSGTATISVDIDEKNTKNCYYSSSCDRPDTFTFNVAKDGMVTGKDALTKRYLETMDRLNDRKADYAGL